MSTCTTCGGTGTIGGIRRLDPLTGRTVSRTKIPCKDCS